MQAIVSNIAANVFLLLFFYFLYINVLFAFFNSGVPINAEECPIFA